MNIIDTTILRSCTDCTDIQDLICLIDRSLSVSAAAMLNNARFGLNIPVNRSADIALLHFRDLLHARSFNPQYASPVPTSQITAVVTKIVSAHGLRL